ncbi:hypothetical protein KEM09_12450 [Carboxylicivirga mesophila]|uniref:NERD domain-containing protein n=1 Tax=Carboxylicivirga mesophila TaxID=1166478 RepID=A0ABS5KB18_9BACT|nr:hypothetical protein [Carboxylicivirga mesophila]MBS2212220.1 hypothetical protein [Carboxylicivirga mesophila]
MARLNIYGNIILTFEYEPYKDIYWTKLSENIIEKYGEGVFEENSIVESILLDSFQFLVNEFRSLIQEENTYSFFSYVFFLHEQSLKFLVKTRDGYPFGAVNEDDFSLYRRILKLTLEQGCDIDLSWGYFPTGKQILDFDEKIQRLYYLGQWIYTYADIIAYQKMIDNANLVDFDAEHQIGAAWQKHYGKVYDELFPQLKSDYSNSVYDESAVVDLKNAINTCFSIDYDLAVGLIFQIKEQFSKLEWQTIEPNVLPINLAYNCNIDNPIAETFYNGLSLSRLNKLSLEEAILKPYSTKRYMYRPILIYKIDNVDRALVGEGKVAESLYVLANNAISWNTIPEDWTANKCMVKFMSKKGNEHDKILEDDVEQVLLKHGFKYCRNIKSFKRPNTHNLNIDNQLAGEIDFIIINEESRKIFVVDSKYNKARYEAVGYRTDYTNFIKSYERQLKRKIDWVSGNKEILQEHIKIMYNVADYEITEYDVEGLFFINTPTFYMFNGEYKAIPKNKIEVYLIGDYTLPVIEYQNHKGEKVQVQHPYFK